MKILLEKLTQLHIFYFISFFIFMIIIKKINIIICERRLRESVKSHDGHDKEFIIKEFSEILDCQMRGHFNLITSLASILALSFIKDFSIVVKLCLLFVATITLMESIDNIKLYINKSVAFEQIVKR